MFSKKLTKPIANLSFEHRALLFAELSAIAYYSEKDATRQAKTLGFTTVEFYNIEGAEAYRFMNKHDFIIACRGTQPKQWNDIKADAEAWPIVAETVGRVHKGFKKEVDKLWPKIEEDLEREQADRNVWFTGHSLGAGMATICASRCKGENKCINPKELHTYGTPRVGWPSYINHIPFTHYRWRNNNDIVTRVPMRWMGYKHHGKCNYFNHFGNLRNLTPWQITKDRWRGFFVSLLKGKFDPIADHNINEYIKHLNNLANSDETPQPSTISSLDPTRSWDPIKFLP